LLKDQANAEARFQIAFVVERRNVSEQKTYGISARNPIDGTVFARRGEMFSFDTSSGSSVMTNGSGTALGVTELRGPLVGEEVVEIPILLPGWQASFLETLAHQRGLTAAAMVRHLLRDFLAEMPASSARM
jgi:hypothetical protein